MLDSTTSLTNVTLLISITRNTIRVKRDMPYWLIPKVLRRCWDEGTPLVFELEVDDIDGWEIPLLVCVAGPRYQPATFRRGAAIGRGSAAQSDGDR